MSTNDRQQPARKERSTKALIISPVVVILVLVVGFSIPSLFQALRVQRLSDCATIVFEDGPLKISTLSTRPQVEPYVIDPFFQQLQEKVDSVAPEERCSQFGVKPHNETSPRRIFFGSLLGDDNRKLFEVLAAEAYGLFDVMAFVESNTTFMATPRKMHYKDTTAADKLQYSNMFGNQTRVIIDYWLKDWPDLRELQREAEQRDLITKVWKQAGMTERDLGLVVDIDEIVSRDFLQALKVCDFPELQKQESHPSCQRPKLSLGTVVYESSPFCVSKRSWFHPDVIVGQCVQDIGDPSERVSPKRKHKHQFGERSKLWGLDNTNEYPKHVLETNKFPLFSGNDIRRVAGSNGLTNYKEKPGQGSTAAYGVAFHLHNWFDDLETLRHKYKTYGHPTFNAHKAILSDIQEDLDLVVRCVHGKTPIIGKKTRHKRDYYHHNNTFKTFWKNLGGPKPIYFMNETYLEERHSLLQSIVAKDEEKYGSRYASTS